MTVKKQKSEDSQSSKISDSVINRSNVKLETHHHHYHSSTNSEKVVTGRAAEAQNTSVSKTVISEDSTIDDIVDHYFSSSSPFKSKIYSALGSLFVVFAIIGIWLPGWPTVSWAVPAAFLFSLSNEKLFRWSLTNEYFGNALFRYYVTGKTLPYHVKAIIASLIALMSFSSAYFVWYVSTKGDGNSDDHIGGGISIHVNFLQLDI